MNAALIVIDMQNDYLLPSRKPMFAYDTEALVSSVNAIIRSYDALGRDIIYIRHIIHDFPTNRWLFGYSIAGSEGAELYGGLDVVSDHRFDKYIGDALSVRALRELIAQKRYDRLDLCGLDECGCVASTALGAARRGLSAAILREGTATVFPVNKAEKVRARLRRSGIPYI